MSGLTWGDSAEAEVVRLKQAIETFGMVCADLKNQRDARDQESSSS